MNKRRGFSVEAVQTIGLLVDKGVILRNELPADLGGVDGRPSCHDETVIWRCHEYLRSKVVSATLKKNPP